MGISKEKLMLAGIFLIVLGLRLFFAFKTTNLTEDISYFNLRQIESIRNTGLPIYNDPLSYSGRFYIFLPLFHYLMAFFSLMIPLAIAVKLIPNLLISLLVFLAYLCAKEITNNEESSIIAALLSGFLPIIFLNTVNTLSAYTLVLPLAFAILLSLMRVERNRNYTYIFILFVLLMTFTDQSIIILLFGFFVYLFLAWLEKLSPNKLDLELILFSTLFVLLLSFLLFKNVFLTYGPDFIRQNIPSELIYKYFSGFKIFEAIYQIGLIPLIFGVYIIYRQLFVEKNRSLYVLISFALSLSVLLMSGLIELKVGLLYFSVVLAILSGGAYKLFSDYLKQTKFSRYHPYLLVIFLVLFVVSSLVPSLVYANQAISSSVKDSDMQAFKWLEQNTSPDSVVVASLGEGHLITSIAKRKNMIDSNFVLQKDSEQVLDDLRVIYTTRFQTEAVRLLTKYNIDYVVFSDMIKDDYGIDKISYIEEGDCFELVYDSEIKIYKSKCVVEEV